MSTITWQTKFETVVKPKSWPKVVVPFLCGTSLGVLLGNQSIGILGNGLSGLMLFSHTMVILIFNDLADEQCDRLKRSLFSQNCSAKTLPDGILTRSQLLMWGMVFVLIFAYLVVTLSVIYDRPLLVVLGILQLILFQIYSFAPVKLNYRGFGELCEMIGIGFLLPYTYCYLQSGVKFHDSYWIFLPFCLLAFTSALTSGLSDEQSDRIAGKKTFTTRLGQKWIVKAVVVLIKIACLILSFSCYWLFSMGLIQLFVLLAPLCYYAFKFHQVMPQVATNQFLVHKQLKNNLHYGLWLNQIIFSVLIWGGMG